MNILAVCGASVITAVLALMLKKHGSELSFILAVCSVTLIAAYILSCVVLSIEEIKNIIQKSQINSRYIEIILKCVGICFLTEFSCDCCKDAAQSALSGVVLLSGRICILITALPLFTEFLDFALSLSGGSI